MATERLVSLLLVGALVSCTTTAPVRDEKRDPPIGHSAGEAMFQFRATWEGKFTGNGGEYCVDGKGAKTTFRISIGSEDNVRVFRFRNAQWEEIKPGQFRMIQLGSQAIISSITSGRDDDGTWVEGSTYTLVHHDTDTVIAYWLRTVNNLDLPMDKPYYHFAWCFTGTMHRVPNGG